jgi:flagellar biosynthesis anti-sigma factor FlgM
MVGITPPNITRLRPVNDADTLRAGTGGPVPASFPASARPAGPEAPATDGLSLSAQARTLSEGMLKGPPVDSALVERLSAAIAEGRYPVDPDRIAQAMFADSFDLPN